MTRYTTDSRLLTWASTPWSRRRLLRVARAVSAPPGPQHQRHAAAPPTAAALLLRAAAWARAMLRRPAPEASPATPTARAPHAAAGARDDGCAVCRGAHFELGGTAPGHEYL